MAKAAIVDQVNHTHLALDFDFERPSAKVPSTSAFRFNLWTLAPQMWPFLIPVGAVRAQAHAGRPRHTHIRATRTQLPAMPYVLLPSFPSASRIHNPVCCLSLPTMQW